MELEEKKYNKSLKTRIAFIIAFILIGYLLLENYSLKERLDYYVEKTDEFHSNIYARVDSNPKDGSHDLAVSDVYYKRYFKSSEKEDKN